jgi:hypothetical protein
MFTTDPEKIQAIQLGEAAGEEFALQVFADGGIDALAATLQPRPYESFSAAFYELWGGGPEKWNQIAKERRIAYAKGCPEDFYKAFREVFARGARRLAEMLVRGYLDARAGHPLKVEDDGSVKSIETRLAVQRRRTALGERKALLDAYETGHKLFTRTQKKAV